ncbi:putative peptidase S16, lon domain protein [Teredinibacter turnerae T7901]|uniref:Peptidase S16, lon domain protein n=1 Tax=Teredinibacter turnerae (strain ATCC 39867 / T7901) TaxID=377629 RepID=C5BTC0_TERTT|nr:LON peptidase substrate-binding domain-containing protein [Teredinibacter turnerae]ACR14590.1 putative peptidase S16, lon domain protein [Teredinibacter turnerae T7901]
MSDTNFENRLAVFPLNIPLLPACRLPLQIFERRYLDMVSDCLQTDSGFVIPLLKEGSEDQEVLKDLPKAANSPDLPFYRVGTLAHIEDFGQRENGLLSLSVVGTQRYVLDDIVQGPSGLWSASAKPLDEDGILDSKLTTSLTQYLEDAITEQTWQQLGLEREALSGEQVINYLVTLLPLPSQLKQILIETDLLPVRQQKLVDFIRLLSADDSQPSQ